MIYYKNFGLECQLDIDHKINDVVLMFVGRIELCLLQIDLAYLAKLTIYLLQEEVFAENIYIQVAVRYVSAT